MEVETETGREVQIQRHNLRRIGIQMHTVQKSGRQAGGQREYKQF